jgi:hypothetical protein
MMNLIKLLTILKKLNLTYHIKSKSNFKFKISLPTIIVYYFLANKDKSMNIRIISLHAYINS